MIETAEMLATTWFRIYNCCCGMNRNRDVHMEVLESPNEWPTMEQLMRIHRSHALSEPAHLQVVRYQLFEQALNHHPYIQ